MAIRLIVDSGSDFTKEDADRLGYEFVPLSITFGDDNYQDGINLTKDRFYELLEEFDEFPKSASPAPQYFYDAYNKITEDGDIGLYVALGSGVSSSYQTGKMISEEFENIYALDSGSVSVGTNVIIQEADRLIKEGKDIQEIIDHLETFKKRMTIYAYLGTLDYLKKGGRISTLSQVIGNMLSIKPIVKIKDGKVKLFDKQRGKKKAVKELAKHLQKDNIKVENMYMGYSGKSKEYMLDFIQSNDFLRDNYKNEILQLGSTVGSYGGNEVIGIAFLEN